MGLEELPRRLCLCVDVQGYGTLDDRGQSRVQVELLDLLDAAARGAGLDRDVWIRQAQGDGELSLIPVGQPEGRVLDEFVGELAVQVYRRNSRQADGPRLRLRVALDFGPVQNAVNGFSGRCVVVVSRLVGSRPIRLALSSAPDAGVALIVSSRVYADLVLGGHTGLPSTAFRKVPVREKEYAEDAWLWVPGFDVHQLPLCDDPADSSGTDTVTHSTASSSAPPHGPDPRASAPQSVANVFHGRVNARKATFGIRNG
jgi:class 3 adenylate cyclase